MILCGFPYNSSWDYWYCSIHGFTFESCGLIIYTHDIETTPVQTSLHTVLHLDCKTVHKSYHKYIYTEAAHTVQNKHTWSRNTHSNSYETLHGYGTSCLPTRTDLTPLCLRIDSPLLLRSDTNQTEEKTSHDWTNANKLTKMISTYPQKGKNHQSCVQHHLHPIVYTLFWSLCVCSGFAYPTPGAKATNTTQSGRINVT